MELLVQVPKVNRSIKKMISVAKCKCCTLLHRDKKGAGETGKGIKGRW